MKQHLESLPVSGDRVILHGEEFYRIANFDRLRPFFMSIVSPGDHWMFISSNGGLTAGRQNPDLALFPYYTDDKIRDMAEVTGSKTIIRLRKGNRHTWEPLSERGAGCFRTRRNLYKNFRGNKLVFEEINADLSLTFRYGWFNSNRFGFVRRAWLENLGKKVVHLSILDGVQNIMPCGTTSQFNLEYSTLLDAYKKSELIPETGLGLFRLSAIPVDRPEPAEALRTNVAWAAGLKARAHLLSSVQADDFRQGWPIRAESDVRGERGAYLIQADLNLRSGQTAEWMIVADVNQGSSQVAKLNNQSLLTSAATIRKVLADVEAGSRELDRIVASADGLQKSATPLGNARHYSNTLFNVMRGGTFDDGYRIDPTDLRSFIADSNKEVGARHQGFFRNLLDASDYHSIVAMAVETGDPQLERLCREYLPLTFSRRHGDPSRPWNRFSIATQKPDGSRILDYQGNWRDIFQNWEALAISFPDFVSGMICRFVNASTVDGYNPYRITRHGIDWEVLDPHDPWSYIGYWGDHQIIYLLKLLELFERHEPANLRSFLSREIFSFANVPYRIKPYDELIENPKATVDFDANLHKQIQKRVSAIGADGKLLAEKGGKVLLVNLAEKLLIPILAKLSNFIPGAGIWLNTQRPEWNDANNALVGNGASMVTLYYLRRHLTFYRGLFGEGAYPVSKEVADFLFGIDRTLKKHAALLKSTISDAQRQRVLADVGRAGSDYRDRIIYGRGFSGSKTLLRTSQLVSFFDTALNWINHSIRSNRRRDGLYHSYNLVRFDARKEVPIRRLYPMLEGQVAVLSSGALSGKESLDVLKALRKSAMYRPDQHSYLLYPDRALPRFCEKNNIPSISIRRSRLLQKLIASGNQQLIERDVTGKVHFNPGIKNSADISRILDELASGTNRALVERERAQILHAFERVFDHESFTGRSGTFFGYEGLGCIYWHMVSKLLLATQESFVCAVEAGAPSKVLKELAERYREIRVGLGDRKTPQEYGAFPTDPYSHTPGQGSARQPGLTGQVKEDILCRFGELGVIVRDGQICFKPRLLSVKEFLKASSTFAYVDVPGRERVLNLPPNSLAFTYCQTPVVYQLGNDPCSTIHYSDGRSEQIQGAAIDKSRSASIFNRTGVITKLVVFISRDSLWQQ